MFMLCIFYTTHNSDGFIMEVSIRHTGPVRHMKRGFLVSETDPSSETSNDGKTTKKWNLKSAFKLILFMILVCRLVILLDQSLWTGCGKSELDLKLVVGNFKEASNKRWNYSWKKKSCSSKTSPPCNQVTLETALDRERPVPTNT